MALTSKEQELLLAEIAELVAEMRALRHDITTLRSAAVARRPLHAANACRPAGRRSAA